MDGYPLTPELEKKLAGLRERWPDMDITYDWFGFLAVPKGTDPVIVTRFSEGVDAKLAAWRDANWREPGVPVSVVEAFPFKHTDDDEGELTGEKFNLPIDLE